VSAHLQTLAGSGMTSRRARLRLIQRLWTAGIRNEAVLRAILDTPRHLFVEEALASRAYEDTALPIGFGQTISQPFVVARMTAALLEEEPRPRKVLEIGSGSGYQAALLARLIDKVYSIERIAPLLAQARDRIRFLGLDNVRTKHDDGQSGWPRYAPYDGIVITAAAARIPPELLAQLDVGGRLVAPVGNTREQQLMRLERKTVGFEKQILGPVSFVPLLGGVL